MGIDGGLLGHFLGRLAHESGNELAHKRHGGRLIPSLSASTSELLRVLGQSIIDVGIEVGLKKSCIKLFKVDL